MEQVTRQTSLLELNQKYPELKQVFEKRRIPWVDMTCLDKNDNTIEDAAAICGLMADELVDELNHALENSGRKP